MSLKRFLFIFIMYLVLGAILPFIRYKEISAEHKSKFKTVSYNGNGEAGDRVRILENNTDALDERLRLMAHAEKYIILATFDFACDDSGKDVLCGLLDAAERGVKVMLLVDGFCEILKMRSNKYFSALRSCENAEICVYNKINPFKPWKSMGRMHDKYLIADGKLLIMGGRNISDEFLRDKHNKKIDRDILVYNENAVQNSFIKSVEHYFEEVRNTRYCEEFYPIKSKYLKNSAKTAFSELKNRYNDIVNEKSGFLADGDYSSETTAVNKITLISNPTDIYAKEPHVFHALAQLMEKSKETVIHTPYMVFNNKMYDKFRQVADKSKIGIMLNSVMNSVNIFTASDYFYNKSKLMAMGVDIYELNNFSAYHGKSLTFDNSLCAIGSFNFDIRSTYIDTEIMAVIDSVEINAGLREHMQKYEKFASPAKCEKEKGIPFLKRAGITVIHWFRIIRRLF